MQPGIALSLNFARNQTQAYTSLQNPAIVH
jgi:hypothetical protein